MVGFGAKNLPPPFSVVLPPQWQTYVKLIADDFRAKLASAMAEREVLVIGGHNLPPSGYTHLVANIVRYARELFRQGVRTDENGFKRMMQELAEEQYGATEQTRILLLDLFSYLDDRFDLVMSILVKIYEHQTGELPITWLRSPFPGLRRFTDQDAPIFFGRERETNEIVDRLEANRVVVVTGASGSGKSSIVWAGVIPKIKDRYHWLRITPGELGDNPFMALALKLYPLLETKNFSAQGIALQLAANPESIDELCSLVFTNTGELLLFIDQFEEVFTLSSADLQHSFLQMLAIVPKSSCIRVILTLRSDFYARCIESELEEILRIAIFTLFVPKSLSLYEMIVRSALPAGINFQEGLPQQILDDTGFEPGSLALMAYLLDELYKLAQQRNSRTLTLMDYESLGGVKGAVGTRAEQVYANLQGTDDEKGNWMRQVFHHLVTVDERGIATRQRAQKDDFDENGLLLIRAFTNARLLVMDQNDIEVAHEALFRSWKRLADWIEATRDDHRTISRMKREAYNWDALNRPEYLLPNAETLKEFKGACKRLGFNAKDSVLELFTKPEQDRLLEELGNPNTGFLRRANIGECLALIGDNRDGLQVNDKGVPEFVWIGFVDKSFWGHEQMYGSFLISQFMVTNLQFSAFIEAHEGYHNIEWWINLTKNSEPEELVPPLSKQSNAPRSNVSIYQAVVFCRWLNKKYHRAKISLSPRLPDIVIGETAQIRLPMQGEWQRACNGFSNHYPWGEWDDIPRANTLESGLGRITAVGMFPHGKTMSGIQDMSGNLWELCLDAGENYNHFDVNSAQPTLRGGSYAHNYRRARCESRGHLGQIRNEIGIRLAIGYTRDFMFHDIRQRSHKN